MKNPELPFHEVSSGNIFADLGLPHAEELLLKAQVASGLKDGDQVAKTQKVTRSEAMHRLIELGLNKR